MLFGVNDKKEPIDTGDGNESQLQEWLRHGREILKALRAQGEAEANNKE